MINKLLDRKIKERSALKLHEDEGNLIDKPKDVASQFNKYFSSIASNLKETKKISVLVPYLTLGDLMDSWANLH